MKPDKEIIAEFKKIGFSINANTLVYNGFIPAHLGQHLSHPLL
jgi:hypothetical protein